MSFKLLAIRPLDGCDKKFLKVLKEGVIYKMYNDYEFVMKDSKKIHSEVKSVNYNRTIPSDFYNIKTTSSVNPDLEINVSAIVGKNGSGKSSIIELLYVILHNIAVKVELYPHFNDNGEEIVIETNIKAEIYYFLNDIYYKITCKGHGIYVSTLEFDKKVFGEEKNIQKSDMESFFYTLSVNYSHYSLNSKNLGSWLNNVFHKNDSYQTPIVLNPFRDEGIIDINNEEYLTKSRLIITLLAASNAENRALVPGKIAEKIKFTLNPQKAKFSRKDKEIRKIILENREEILYEIVFSLCSSDIKKTHTESSIKSIINARDKFSIVTCGYILKKIYTITQRYKPYKYDRFEFIYLSNKYSNKMDSVLVYNQDIFKNFISELKTDFSHITFKLRQAVNFLFTRIINNVNENKFITLESLYQDLKITSKRETRYYMDRIPPSFFDIDIEFQDGSHFNALSSGEKQSIYSTSTLIYHLNNLDSVKEGNLVKYQNVNIIFDEIELYYHPEFQRQFLNAILNRINTTKLYNIKGINFIFVTHSPFILSDIHNNNILFLKNDGTIDKDAFKDKTFGANIHDLLKHSFFLENGSMGEFAIQKITDTINFLNLKKKTKELLNLNEASAEVKKEIENEIKVLENAIRVNDPSKHKEVIELIGEPILKSKLSDMYDEYVAEFSTADILKKKIAELNVQLEKLN